MKNSDDLLTRIGDLEKRVAALEEDREYMEALYKNARELVIKNNRASVLFLQKKFLIDFRRAERLMDRLRDDGVLKTLTG